MTPDTELELWREQWLADTHAISPDEVKRKVERQSRFMRFMIAMELLVTVVIGGGCTMLALRESSRETIILAIGVWILIAVVWLFAIVNRRGTWSPEQATTAAFIDLALRRCRRRLSAAWFAICFYTVEMAFCLTWVYHYNPHWASLGLGAFLMSTTAIIVWVITIVFVGWMIWYRKRRLAELQHLQNLQEQL